MVCVLEIIKLYWYWNSNWTGSRLAFFWICQCIHKDRHKINASEVFLNRKLGLQCQLMYSTIFPLPFLNFHEHHKIVRKRVSDLWCPHWQKNASNMFWKITKFSFVEDTHDLVKVTYNNNCIKSLYEIVPSTLSAHISTTSSRCSGPFFHLHRVNIIHEKDPQTTWNAKW